MTTDNTTNKQSDCENNPEMSRADVPMLIRSVHADGFCRMNQALRTQIGYTEAELSEKPLEFWIKENDKSSLFATLNKEQESCQINHRTGSGNYIRLDVQIKEHEGNSVALARVVQQGETVEDPTDDDDEATVRGTLHTIARIVEEQNPGYRCSILLVADGRFVRGAGPSLPEEYNAAIDGFAIGPTVGSCGTAIYWGVPVIVEDIQADPLWAPFAELAKKAGVAACWSHPFSSRSGSVLGALALYSPVPRAPTSEQLSRLKAAASMTGLAVERGRAEEALRKQRQTLAELLNETAILKQKAEEANLLKDQFLTNMSHEMRTPMNAIIGMTDLTLESELSELQNEQLSIVRDSATALLSIINDVLDFSKLEAGGLNVSERKFQLTELLTQVEKRLQSTAERKKIEMVIESVCTETKGLYGDPDRIIQVLSHLVNNALKFTPAGGGVVVYIEQVNESNSESSIRFNVSDSGIGIPESKHKDIFESFTQADSSLTRTYGGAGLGLSISGKLVQLMGGDIGLRSREGVGTLFYFTIPLRTAPKYVEPEEFLLKPIEPETITGRAVAPSKTLNVLLAEDNKINQVMMLKLLQKMGHQITIANNGVEVLQQFESESFDVILMDIQMPEMDGIDAAVSIRKLEQELGKEKIPIIAVTAHALFADREKCLNAGMDDYLTKPVEQNQIRDRLNRISAIKR